MSLDSHALDSAKRYRIEGFDLPEPWRIVYADRSEVVLQTITYRLLVSASDLTEVAPGQLRLEGGR